MKTLILTQKEVGSLLSMEQVLPAVEQAFAAHGRGETIMPPKTYLPLGKYGGDFRAMPAYFDGSSGVKWVNAHPQNPKKHGLPAVMALYILSDPENGEPLAIMDATLITAFRTGAAGGVASKHLAGDAKTIGFVGCGVQARHLLEAHKIVNPSLEAFAFDLSDEAAKNFPGKAVSLPEAVGCDIVCTTTPSRKPVVQREWVKAGTHINAMGADAPGKQELDPAILVEGKVLIDDYDQACESGEVNVPLREGLLKRKEIYGTLGEVVAGRKKGREGDEITIFDSTGLAIQDVAVARVVYKAAREKGVGRDIEMIG